VEDFKENEVRKKKKPRERERERETHTHTHAHSHTYYGVRNTENILHAPQQPNRGDEEAEARGWPLGDDVCPPVGRDWRCLLWLPRVRSSLHAWLIKLDGSPRTPGRRLKQPLVKRRNASPAKPHSTL